MSEIRVIAGMPVDQRDYVKLGMPHIEPYVGSIETECERCTAPVWIGPKQQEKRAEGGAQVLCYLCVAKLAHATGGDYDFQKLSDKTTKVWPPSPARRTRGSAHQ